MFHIPQGFVEISGDNAWDGYMEFIDDIGEEDFTKFLDFKRTECAHDRHFRYNFLQSLHLAFSWVLDRSQLFSCFSTALMTPPTPLFLFPAMPNIPVIFKFPVVTNLWFFTWCPLLYWHLTTDMLDLA